MKATLIVIQNKADHAEAKALVATLMRSDAEADHARALAQARLVEAYEKMQWPRRRPTVPDLLGKRDLSMTMIKRLRDRFHVPADLLIPQTARKRTAA